MNSDLSAVLYCKCLATNSLNNSTYSGLEKAGLEKKAKDYLVNYNELLFNFSRAFGDGPRNFEPWSSEKDLLELEVPSPNFHITPTGGYLSLDIFNVHRSPLLGGSLVVLVSNS
ncbi:hypothetical protein TNCV_3209011 [Trichonephila clavipes]|nr:hypothetical protein TNCV_3209011 [Trichonephila clavipes]